MKEECGLRRFLAIILAANDLLKNYENVIRILEDLYFSYRKRPGDPQEIQ